MKKSKFYVTTEQWEIGKLIKMAKTVERKPLCLCDHQRPNKNNKSSAQRIVKSVLSCYLLQPFWFNDLKSSVEVSMTEEDKWYFQKHIDKGAILSIEDGQQRIGALQDVNLDDLGEFQEEFLSTKIEIRTLHDATKEEVINIFTEINSGKVVQPKEILWGIPTNFNQEIKELISNDILRLYKSKKLEISERSFYGNISKMLKICGFYDGIIDSPNTSATPMREFIEKGLYIVDFESIYSLLTPWYEIIKENPKKEMYSCQSNLFFILHVLNNNDIELNQDRVNEIMSQLTDTRSSGEKRYEVILKLITDEK